MRPRVGQTLQTAKSIQDLSNSNGRATFQLQTEHTNPIESAIHSTESSISYIPEQSTSLGGRKAQIFQTQLGGDRYRFLDLITSVRILSPIGEQTTPIISSPTDQSDSESGTDPTG